MHRPDEKNGSGANPLIFLQGRTAYAPDTPLTGLRSRPLQREIPFISGFDPLAKKFIKDFLTD